ncbi:hypothetical protein K438DRAFT_1822735 [Mycena galopus ATCC 62051]|nr:hypothetical protein K438DRAFT_1822735 [Mycena galopus ATCC 62051]
MARACGPEKRAHQVPFVASCNSLVAASGTTGTAKVINDIKMRRYVTSNQLDHPTGFSISISGI